MFQFVINTPYLTSAAISFTAAFSRRPGFKLINSFRRAGSKFPNSDTVPRQNHFSASFESIVFS